MNNPLIENQIRERKVKMWMSAVLAFLTLCVFTVITITIVLQVQSINDGLYTSVAVGCFSFVQLFCCICCCTSCVDYQNYRSRYTHQNIEAPHIIIPPPSAPPLIDKSILDYQSKLNLEHPNHPECVSCLENVRSVKFGCGHLVLCHLCAHQIKNINPICPICRTPITEMKENIFSEKDYSPSESPPPAPDETPI